MHLSIEEASTYQLVPRELSLPIFTVAPARLSHVGGDMTQLIEYFPRIHQSPEFNPQYYINQAWRHTPIIQG